MSYVEEKVLTVDGTVTTKRYQLLAEIGAGSFSQCWKVRPIGTDKAYAMKVIPKKSLQSLEQEKLVNEIQIHRALSHPNIVFLEHSFEDEENQYIFLEYCTNGTLDQRCKKYQCTAEDDIRRFGAQILAAIKYLHSRKILHRDLKLSNCFLGDGDQVKIGDFGFACRLQSHEELKRETCGTPNFLSPEVAGGFGHSFPSDIWSFGVILYRMKFGVCPFETSSLNETIHRIKLCDYSFSKWVNISSSLRDLISSILVVDYDARPTIEQIEKHPFFQPEIARPTLKNSTSLTGFIKRIFSRDKSKEQEGTIKRIDSCKNLIDMKEILKEKTKENVVSLKELGTASTMPTEVKQPPSTHQQISRVYFNKITEAKTFRMPPKGKPKAPSATQYHPHCLITCVDTESDYLVVYLTNGIRQILKEGENFVLLNEGYCCDKTGRRLSSLPKLVSYIIKERLKEASCKLTEQNFEEHVQRRNFIMKYRQLGERRLFMLGNSSILTTPSPTIFFLHSEYCEFLYNSRLETISNSELLKKCQEVLTAELRPTNPLVTLKQKKFLE